MAAVRHGIVAVDHGAAQQRAHGGGVVEVLGADGEV